jgi:hypothetical protein
LQRLLLLLIRSELIPGRARTSLANGVDLIDEDDRRSPLAGLLEEVSNTRCSETDE